MRWPENILNDQKRCVLCLCGFCDVWTLGTLHAAHGRTAVNGKSLRGAWGIHSLPTQKMQHDATAQAVGTQQLLDALNVEGLFGGGTRPEYKLRERLTLGLSKEPKPSDHFRPDLQEA